MFSIKQPKEIIFGKNSAHVYKYPENSLVITSHGAKKRNWIEYLQLKNHYIFDNVEPNPSIDITTSIINEFNSTNFVTIIGVGGGSCLDVAKFVAAKLNKKKILVPTTFGSGSDLTRISVLKVDGKKRSFHDDSLFADVSITDSNFLLNTPGISHGHALAYTTTIAHEFNNSEFYERFLKIVKKLGFSKIKLKQDVEKAASMILEDKKHLDNNPKPVTKNDIVKLLESINTQNEL